MAASLRIFISSPGDVADERRRAALVVSRLRREFSRFFDLSAVLWEYEPMLSSGHFQDIIDPPSGVDIFVMILWSRLGTPLPEHTDKRAYHGLDDGRVPVTGTEWEFEDALRAYRERNTPDLLVYRKTTKGVAEFDSPHDLEVAASQKRALEVFWDRYFGNPASGFKAAFNLFSNLGEFEAHLEPNLRELLRGRLPPGRSRGLRKDGDRIEWWSGSPYRGLQAFDMEYASVFFGRERAEREISEALVRNAADGVPFMLVLGASGSGKSSLVRAGLLPDLMAPGVVSGVSIWRHLIVTPGELLPDPFDGLATALLGKRALPELEELGYRREEIAAQLRAGADLASVPFRLALARAAERDPDSPSGSLRRGRLVLVVDQMEIMFVSTTFTDVMRRAIDGLLAELAKSGLVWVICTLRSDFFHRVVELPLISELVQGRGHYQLAPPSATELELMISRPAEAAGLSFEIDESGISLAAVVREAAARDSASLPLLSFVLDELYRRDTEAGSSMLTYATYRALGGLEGAIAQHADQLMKDLPPELAEEVPALLLALVEIDEIKNTTAGRTLRVASLTSPRQRELAVRLVSRRLAVADGVEAGVTLRLAHEALLAHWPRLAALIDEHRDFLTMRRRLQGEAANWEAQKRHPDFLLPAGRRLAEAEEMLKLWRSDIDPEIVDYADASIEAERDRAAAAQRAKEEGLRRELKRSRQIAVIVSVLLFLALAGGGFAWHEWGIAKQEHSVAEGNYGVVLGQAVDSLNFLEDQYDAGNISSTILSSVIKRSQGIVQRLSDASDDTDEVTAARIGLLGHNTILENSIGDTHAIVSAREENALADRLRDRDPVNPKWLRLWASARGALGIVQYWQCDSADAAREMRSAAEVHKKMLAVTPDDDILHDGLLDNYETMGDAFRALGDLDSADEAYHFLLQDSERTLSMQPGKTRWLSDVGYAEERVGDILTLRGSHEEAAVYYEKFHSVASDLVDNHSQDGNYLDALVQSLQRLGDSWLVRGDAPRAMTEYQEYLGRANMLSNKVNPLNFRFRDFFASAYQRIGELHMHDKNYGAALGDFHNYLTVAEDLRSKNPANNMAIYDVANAHAEIGDALRYENDMVGALEEYEQVLTLAIQLNAGNCQNGAWRKMLAVGYQRTGLALNARGDGPAALAQFRQCAAIPTTPTAWSPASLWPRDTTEYCQGEVARLSATK